MKEFDHWTVNSYDNAIHHLMYIRAFDAVLAILKKITVPIEIERYDEIYTTDQYMIIQTSGSSKAKLYNAEEILEVFGSVELIKEILLFESKLKQIKGESVDPQTDFYDIVRSIEPLVEGDLETLIKGYLKN